jgi:UrcA family protein
MSPKNRYRSIFTRLSTAPVAAALLCVSASTSFAVSAAPLSSDEVTLHYVRSDLSNPQAAELLYKRIQVAARDICLEPPEAELSRHAAFTRCYEAVIDATVAKIDATQLTALHRSKMQRNTAS